MSDTNKAAFAAAAISQHKNTSALENVRKQYAGEKYHEFNTVKEDQMSRRTEMREEKEHKATMAKELAITRLAEEAATLQKSGDSAGATAKNNEINKLRRTSYEGDGFDLDEVTKNYGNTLEEITDDFGTATRAEMKVSINRMSAIMETIADSGAQEKDFLMEQYKITHDAMQAEFKKRANIVAVASEKVSELSEQYLDVSSLYAGFVDHNPLLMGVYKLGADLIGRRRASKKAEKTAIARDEKNAAHADKLNSENLIRANIDAERNTELHNQRKQTADVMAKETDTPEPSEQFPAGDDPINIDHIASIFGSVDEDGDAVVIDTSTFTRDDSIMEPAPTIVRTDEEPGDVIERDKPVPVIVRETAPEASVEQKSVASFIADDEKGQHKETVELQESQFTQGSEILSKLTDIEHAILKGAKGRGKDGKSTTFLAGLFKGPILKALMIIAPAVTLIAALLGKIGLGGLGDKLTGGFDNSIERMGGEKQDRKKNKKRVKKKGGRFTRMRGAGKFGMLSNIMSKGASLFQSATGGVGNLATKGANIVRAGATTGADVIRAAAPKGASMARAAVSKGTGAATNAASKGAGMLRGAGMAGLRVAGGVGLAAQAGWEAGSLLNDHVIPEQAKVAIGDTLGPKIDAMLSFFGNEEATQRQDFIKKQKEKNAKSLGIKTEAAKKKAELKETTNTAFTKISKGSHLVINAEKIGTLEIKNLPGVSNDRVFEVPVQQKSIDRMNDLENQVVKMVEAKGSESTSPPPTILAPAVPTQQTVVSGRGGAVQTPNVPLARNSDSSIQRLTDRFVGMGIA